MQFQYGKYCRYCIAYHHRTVKGMKRTVIAIFVLSTLCVACSKDKEVETTPYRMRFEQTCDSDFGPACFNAAVMAYMGNEGPKDKAKARSFFERGCSVGHAKSCVNLGVMLYNGEGGKKDFKRAVAVGKRACKIGHVEMCRKLSTTKVEVE